MTVGSDCGMAKGRAPGLMEGKKALLIDLDDTLYRQEEVPKRVRKAIESECPARGGRGQRKRRGERGLLEQERCMHTAAGWGCGWGAGAGGSHDTGHRPARTRFPGASLGARVLPMPPSLSPLSS